VGVVASTRLPQLPLFTANQQRPLLIIVMVITVMKRRATPTTMFESDMLRLVDVDHLYLMMVRSYVCLCRGDNATMGSYVNGSVGVVL
jgi:hypothetical protein